MIDIAAWPAVVKLVILLTPFFIGLPGIAISAFVTLTKDYDVACSSITSNPYFERMKRAWGAETFKGRWMVTCTVSGLVAFPWLALRQGTLDPDELGAFPRQVKRRLIVSAWLSVSGFFLMVAVWALFKFK
ncbi:hypothetical protein [Pseudomonas putida]|uniref:hypothetical protein n=1 Tax=Pseudomonas putida TaxID=303 RepID=UPI0037CC106E